jgi:hypothetical protein
MSNQLMELEATLKNQLVIVQEMRVMKDEVAQMKQDIKEDVRELRDSITLTRHEGAELQSVVGRKAWKLADELFEEPVSDDLFLAKVGHFRGIIYKRLKDTFNVARYYDIRRIDFNQAKQVVDIVQLSNLKDYQLRLTARQKEIAEQNGDNISGME